MAKKKNLNGLANNVTQSFLSTINYQCRGFTHCGYGIDWVFAGLKKTKNREVIIDILTSKITPVEMQIPQLKAHLARLQSIILEKLAQNGFTENDLKSAEIICKLPKSNAKYIIAKTEIKLLDNLIIPNSEFQENVSTEVDFFPVSLIEKIRRKITNYNNLDIICLVASILAL